MTDEPRWMTRETMKQDDAKLDALLGETAATDINRQDALVAAHRQKQEQIKDQLVREYNNGQAAGHTTQRERDALVIEERLADITLPFDTRMILKKLAAEIRSGSKPVTCVDPDGHLEACDCPACNARRQALREQALSAPRLTPEGMAGIHGGATKDVYTITSQETRRKQLRSVSTPGCTCMLCEEDRKAGR